MLKEDIFHVHGVQFCQLLLLIVAACG